MFNCDRRYCGNYFDCMRANENLCEQIPCDERCDSCSYYRECVLSEVPLIERIIREEKRKNKKKNKE